MRNQFPASRFRTVETESKKNRGKMPLANTVHSLCSIVSKEALTCRWNIATLDFSSSIIFCRRIDPWNLANCRKNPALYGELAKGQSPKVGRRSQLPLFDPLSAPPPPFFFPNPTDPILCRNSMETWNHWCSSWCSHARILGSARRTSSTSSPGRPSWSGTSPTWSLHMTRFARTLP